MKMGGLVFSKGQRCLGSAPGPKQRWISLPQTKLNPTRRFVKSVHRPTFIQLGFPNVFLDRVLDQQIGVGDVLGGLGNALDPALGLAMIDLIPVKLAENYVV